MERLTKTYEDGTHAAADKLPCGENSHAYKHLVLEALGKYEDTGLTPEEIMDGKMLTGWIPVEERLPKAHVDVLVAHQDFGEDASTFIDGLVDNNGRMTWSTYNGARDRVLAWMPLPEPYKREEQEEASEPCKSCPKAEWIDMYGKIVYGCDMSHCIADDGGRT